MWSGESVFFHVCECYYESDHVNSLDLQYKKENQVKYFYTWNIKANKHDYGDIFSECVLYAAHVFFITIRSTIDHNRKLLKALDDGLKWVLQGSHSKSNVKFWLSLTKKLNFHDL